MFTILDKSARIAIMYDYSARGIFVNGESVANSAILSLVARSGNLPAFISAIVSDVSTSADPIEFAESDVRKMISIVHSEAMDDAIVSGDVVTAGHNALLSMILFIVAVFMFF